MLAGCRPWKGAIGMRLNDENRPAGCDTYVACRQAVSNVCLHRTSSTWVNEGVVVGLTGFEPATP